MINVQKMICALLSATLKLPAGLFDADGQGASSGEALLQFLRTVVVFWPSDLSFDPLALTSVKALRIQGHAAFGVEKIVPMPDLALHWGGYTVV